jgi:glycosyltransferase involved in cell wall biosynthesis
MKIAILSSYPPRRCGVGAFAEDLYQNLVEVAPDLDLLVCAVDRDGLRYGDEVATVLHQDDQAGYRKTAADLAAAGVDAVLIQHEFGIYGGPDGAWLTSFTAELSATGVPYIVTLHTVPAAPSRGQAGVLQRLCRGAAVVTVFTPTAQRLAAAAGVRTDRFETIPHGVPALLRSPDRRHSSSVTRPHVAKALAEFERATVVSTFGLVSPTKGLETAIAAVADLARELPDLRYLIAGATHPEVVRRHGEGYRRSLGELVADLEAGDHVRFLDCFLTDAEVAALLTRTAVFLTPYRSRDQVVSGALTFALAAGCPVVSTSFYYAQDMLIGGAGLLADPGDTAAYTEALRRMLTEPGRLARAADAAWAAGAELVWPVVAQRAADVIRSAVARRHSLRAVGAQASPRPVIPYQR